MTPRRPRTVPAPLLLALVAFGAALSPAPVRAQPPEDAGAPDAATTSRPVASSDPAAAPRPDDPARTAADRIRALIAGELDVAVAPASLFDAPLDDEAAIRLSAARIRLLLARAQEDADAADAGAPDGGPRSRDAGTPAVGPRPPDAGDAGAGDAEIDAALWEAHLALDRARLAFYELPRARRDEILAVHERRRAEVEQPRETEQERRARLAEEEQRRALEAARKARTEAERLVSEELARLLGVEREHAALAQRLADDRRALTVRLDLALGMQRRAREARESASPAEADEAHEAVRASLRGVRDELGAALTAVASQASAVPEIGPDPLPQIPPEIDAEPVRAKRRDLIAGAGRLRLAERALRSERAKALLDEMDTLNRERLALLPHLSAERRAAVTGLSSAGWDQAKAELRHLLLVVRYHRFATGEWLASMKSGDAALGGTLARLAAVLVPASLAVLLFAGWRRRAGRLLDALAERIEEADKAARVRGPSFASRALRFVRGVRSPIEWLALFGALEWLLPDGTRALLEVQLLVQIIGWTIAGSIVVNAINASFAAAAPAPGATDAEDLRLRSLRLIGRVVLAFVLVLVVSARLVGEGTVYGWVFRMCWFAALPVFLVLVRWWRATVFDRIEHARKRTPFQRWALSNRTGYRSLLAATGAAVHLFVSGAARVARHWVSGFDVARRAHAYLFRRELTKLEKDATAHLRPLPDDLFRQMDPLAPPPVWTKAAPDEIVQRLLDRANEPTGACVALLGEWGSGKSAALARVAERASSAVRVTCSRDGGLAGVMEQLRSVAPSPGSRTLDDLGGALDASPVPAVLVDDAQILVRPVMGGLADFDRLLSAARAHSASTTWIFAIDSAVWPFLRRARGETALFDEVVTLEPWSEEEITALIDARDEHLGISPGFEALLDELPPNADETDRLDALAERRTGYIRFLWDAARGNPGAALELWRGSLAAGPDDRVLVRPLPTSGEDVLSALSDPELFVLRAVLQMHPATAADIEEATRLPRTVIADALRHGLSRGYLAGERGGAVSVSRARFCDVVRLLERRHLLVKL